MTDNAATQVLSPARRRIHSAAVQLFAEMDVTRVNISDLATVAGIARGTVYNNVGDAEGLFDEVSAHLVSEMGARVTLSFGDVEDLALRMAFGIRHYLRRAHEEPNWGRFINRFGYSNATLRALWETDPVRNLQAGIRSGRYRITQEQLPSAVGMLTGTVVAAMLPVLEGHRTWRDAGAETAQLLLIALGIDREEARALSLEPLPPLPRLPLRG